jgi:hypothetical protein
MSTGQTALRLLNGRKPFVKINISAVDAVAPVLGMGAAQQEQEGEGDSRNVTVFMARSPGVQG